MVEGDMDTATVVANIRIRRERASMVVIRTHTATTMTTTITMMKWMKCRRCSPKANQITATITAILMVGMAKRYMNQNITVNLTLSFFFFFLYV
jgi:hypothetical protein